MGPTWEPRVPYAPITAKPREEGVYKGILPVMEQILRQKRNANILRFVRSLPCRACQGTRLRPEALAVTVGGMNIAEAAALTIDDLRRFFAGAGEGGSIHDLGREMTAEQREHRFAQFGRFMAHGIGMVSHEQPTLSAHDARPLEAGMILSIETDFIHPEAVFMLHGFGHENKLAARSYNKGVSDALLQANITDKVGGSPALHDTIVTVKPV